MDQKFTSQTARIVLIQNVCSYLIYTHSTDLYSPVIAAINKLLSLKQCESVSRNSIGSHLLNENEFFLPKQRSRYFNQ